MEPFRQARGIAFFSLFVFFLIIEWLWPLRNTTRSKPARIAENLGVGLVSAWVIRVLLIPFVILASELATARGWGLLRLLNLSGPAYLAAAILLLDYTLYLWHWANHRISFLWRFHLVHHIDLDMDVSTASRFHFGELALSTVFRSVQAILIGVDPVTLVIFEVCVTSAAQFHHANIYLPFSLERALNLLFVTPRMHELHHSTVVRETDSNYSTIFSWWDSLHRSLSRISGQQRTQIGVQEFRSAPSLLGLLGLPFTPSAALKRD